MYSHDAILIFLEMPQNTNNFDFGSFSVFKPATCFFFEMPHFQYAFFFEMSHFPISRIRWANGASQGKKHIEIGERLGKSHDRFQNRKGTEIETVWGISKKNHNTLT